MFVGKFERYLNVDLRVNVGTIIWDILNDDICDASDWTRNEMENGEVSIIFECSFEHSIGDNVGATDEKL